MEAFQSLVVSHASHWAELQSHIDDDWIGFPENFDFWKLAQSRDTPHISSKAR